MIREVRSKVSKTPEDNYTEAVCDGCEAVCPESRLLGRRGIKAANEAYQLAIEHGYAKRHVADKKRRKMSWIIHILCPECQVSESGRAGSGAMNGALSDK
jgi:hypothetical protein